MQALQIPDQIAPRTRSAPALRTDAISAEPRAAFSLGLPQTGLPVAANPDAATNPSTIDRADLMPSGSSVGKGETAMFPPAEVSAEGAYTDRSADGADIGIISQDPRSHPSLQPGHIVNTPPVERGNTLPSHGIAAAKTVASNAGDGSPGGATRSAEDFRASFSRDGFDRPADRRRTGDPSAEQPFQPPASKKPASGLPDEPAEASVRNAAPLARATETAPDPATDPGPTVLSTRGHQRAVVAARPAPDIAPVDLAVASNAPALPPLAGSDRGNPAAGLRPDGHSGSGVVLSAPDASGTVSRPIQDRIARDGRQTGYPANVERRSPDARADLASPQPMPSATDGTKLAAAETVSTAAADRAATTGTDAVRELPSGTWQETDATNAGKTAGRQPDDVGSDLDPRARTGAAPQPAAIGNALSDAETALRFHDGTGKPAETAVVQSPVPAAGNPPAPGLHEATATGKTVLSSAPPPVAPGTPPPNPAPERPVLTVPDPGNPTGEAARTPTPTPTQATETNSERGHGASRLPQSTGTAHNTPWPAAQDRTVTPDHKRRDIATDTVRAESDASGPSGPAQPPAAGGQNALAVAAVQPAVESKPTAAAEPGQFDPTIGVAHGMTADDAVAPAPRPTADAMAARQIAVQLADVAHRFPGRPVEITLNPEELGRVRMTLTASDTAVTVNLFAERGETAELLRRNIETLAQEFRAIGYSDVAFEFGGGQSGDADRDGRNANGDAVDPRNGGQQTDSKIATGPQVRITLSDRIDIRL